MEKPRQPGSESINPDEQSEATSGKPELIPGSIEWLVSSEPVTLTLEQSAQLKRYLAEHNLDESGMHKPNASQAPTEG